MSSFSLSRLPFWLHSLIELIPSVLFLFDPAGQLSAFNITSAAPRLGAEAVVCQYGLLLLVSTMISTIFAVRKIDATSRQVAAALSFYHLGPVVRATLRISGGEKAWQPDDMGGPSVHLVVHIILLLALGGLASGVLKDEHKIKVLAKRN